VEQAVGGLADSIGTLFSGVLLLGFMAFGLILIVSGTAGAKRAARGTAKVLTLGLWHALRFTVGGMLLIVFTVIDAAITTTLVAYQTGTGRPFLVGDTWAAFAQRLNDRTLKILLQ
jgi:hypothetical protein